MLPARGVPNPGAVTFSDYLETLNARARIGESQAEFGCPRAVGEPSRCDEPRAWSCSDAAGESRATDDTLARIGDVPETTPEAACADKPEPVRRLEEVYRVQLGSGRMIDVVM